MASRNGHIGVFLCPESGETQKYECGEGTAGIICGPGRIASSLGAPDEQPSNPSEQPSTPSEMPVGGKIVRMGSGSQEGYDVKDPSTV